MFWNKWRLKTRTVPCCCFSHVSSLKWGVESQSPGGLRLPRTLPLREGVISGACGRGAITPEAQLTGQNWCRHLPAVLQMTVRVLQERLRAGVFRRHGTPVYVQMCAPQTAGWIHDDLGRGFWCWRAQTHGNHVHQSLRDLLAHLSCRTQGERSSLNTNILRTFRQGSLSVMNKRACSQS